MKYSTLLLLAVIFASCTSNDKKQNNTGSGKDTITKNSQTLADTSSTHMIGYYKVEGDSLVIPSFEIDVSLSDKANQKLQKDKETIIVAAYFSGQPKDTTSEAYQESGEMGVAHAEKELSDARVAKFERVKFSRALYDSLADKDIQLLINIYSGRRSTDVNLLDCDILDDKMSNVKDKKYTLKGKLIAEHN